MICDSRRCNEYTLALSEAVGPQARNPRLHLGWAHRRQRHAAELRDDLTDLDAGRAHTAVAMDLVALKPHVAPLLHGELGIAWSKVCPGDDGRSLVVQPAAG